jgi:WD40 repeat protein
MIRFNADASLITTAPERETLIRIMDARTGEIIEEFRRRLFHATMASTAFSQNGKTLVAYSDEGTVHIFTLNEMECGGEQKRAIVISKLPICQLAIADFLNQEAFAIFQIDSGEVEILACNENTIVAPPKFFSRMWIRLEPYLLSFTWFTSDPYRFIEFTVS